MLIINRRNFLASSLGTVLGSRLASGHYKAEKSSRLKITDLELVELRGHYEGEAGVNKQPQVNPLNVYDELRPKPYKDVPGGTKKFPISAIYLRIKTSGDLFGLYGPLERSAAIVVEDELRPFLIGKDPLAGEELWDQMYRSNRHSRDGLSLLPLGLSTTRYWIFRGGTTTFLFIACWEDRRVNQSRSTEAASAFRWSPTRSEQGVRRCSKKDIDTRSGLWHTGLGPGLRECRRTFSWSRYYARL